LQGWATDFGERWITFTLVQILSLTVEVPSQGNNQSLSVVMDYTHNKRFQGQEARQQGTQETIQKDRRQENDDW
jgi:hypothetical protein